MPEIAELPGPGRTRVVLVLLSLAIFVTFTYEVLPIGLLTPIGDALGIDAQGAGLLISGYAVVVALGSIPLSAAVARFDARRTLLVLLGVLSISSGLLAVSTSLTVAAVARLMGGAAHAVIFTTVYRLALAVVPVHQRGRAAGAVAIGNGAALALGVPLATAFGIAAGWRVAFAVTAAGFVVTAILAVVLIPAGIGRSGQRLSTRILLDAIRQRPLVRVGVTILAMSGAHFVTYTYVEPILLEAGVAPSSISLVLLGYGIAGVVALLITAGSAIGGWILAATDSTVLILVSIAAAAAVTAVSSIRTWLPADKSR